MTVLSVQDLGKAFGGIRAVDGCSFAIEQPGIVGVIGPNGAGKTTLFDLVTGNQVPDRGSIGFEGRDITGLAPHRLSRLGLARTFQECRVLPEESCLDNLLFAVQPKALARTLWDVVRRDWRVRRRRAEAAMRLLSLVRLDGYADKPASTLSFGQKRLLEIVATFMGRPELILFDEPASGVNPALLDTLHAFILAMHKERPILFLIVEHNMDFIMSLSDQVVVMHQGRVLEQGTPAAVQASPAVIEAYLG
jgi:ABC-type branched-subunit amino acid transport system ATPase component